MSSHNKSFLWSQVTNDLYFYLLRAGDVCGLAKQVRCHQDIGYDSSATFAMTSEYGENLYPTVRGLKGTHNPGENVPTPWMYPRLFWEAGMVGQVIYLEAERLSEYTVKNKKRILTKHFQATGIGCYFDDPVHDVINVKDCNMTVETNNIPYYQSFYHIAIGVGVEDSRISTLEPYHHLK